MPVEILTNVALYVGGYDLGGDFNKLALEDGIAEFATPCFGDVGVRRVSGLGDVALSGAGYWNRDAAKSDEILHADIGVADVPVAIGPNGLADGDVAYIFRCLAASYSPTADINAPAPFTVAGKGSAGERLGRGTVMANAETLITGDGTIRQLGAVAAGQRMYASLHVLGVAVGGGGGGATLNVTVRSDNAVDFVGSSLRLTFAQQTTAIGSDWKTSDLTAITDTYWRVSWAIAAGPATFTFAVVLAIH